jgi:DNA polymerase (family X)
VPWRPTETTPAEGAGGSVPARGTAPTVAGAPARRTNAAVADMLREMAVLLQAQGDNPYRVAAYRKAADTVAALSTSVREIFERDGHAGLESLPHIGTRISAAIEEILSSGRWIQLDRLRGNAGPDAVFRTIPGVGPQLARQLHEVLGVDTLEALEAAAHDGRLEQLPRVGARRAAAIRATLTQMLDRTRSLRRTVTASPSAQDPPVEWLLDVDREYRERALAGTLPTIAPRRFNPGGEAWLAVLHTRRGDWDFTALYSNTARAHELGHTHDWVVIYGEDARHAERQYTVVTATHGLLAGQRVVRGRETDCQAWYAGEGGLSPSGPAPRAMPARQSPP